MRYRTMNVQTFQKYMQERGFRTTEKTAFGMEGAYPVTVTFLGARSWQAVFPVDIPDWKSFYTEIKDSLRGLGSLVYGKSRLTLTMPIKDEDSQAVYSQAIALVLGRLQAQGIPALDLCPLCGQGQCDCAAYLRGCYQGTHRSCLEKQLSETTEKAEQNAMYGNYVTGFVGALLGMAIGVIHGAHLCPPLRPDSALHLLWVQAVQGKDEPSRPDSYHHPFSGKPLFD